MKTFFAWCPLAPPTAGSRPSPALATWADRGAYLFLGLGLLQVVAGLDEGWGRLVPLAIGLLLFGLPHGAIDHLVALGLAGRSLQLLPLSAVLSLYLSVVMAVLALWVLLPGLAALGFLIMTIYHWGKGDLAFERCDVDNESGFRGSLANGIHLILRGLIPIGLPFLIFPDQASEFINACVRFFAPDRVIDWSLWRSLLLIAFVGFFCGDLWVHLRHFRQPLARRVLMENFALALFFSLVPPVIAIGWYFAGWHGFRHLLRLARYQAVDRPAALDLPTGLARLGWQAFPFTVVSVIMLLILYIGMADRVTDSFQATALYLVLISALTLPHLIIVEWMDRREKSSHEVS